MKKWYINMYNHTVNSIKKQRMSNGNLVMIKLYKNICRYKKSSWDISYQVIHQFPINFICCQDIK